MSLVVGDPERDFFEQNPVMKFKSEFKELIKRYPKTASKIAWAVFMIEDPGKSNKFHRMPREERIEEVIKNYYPIDIEEHKDLMKAYSRLCLTKEETMFKIHMDKLEELTVFLKELSLDEEADFNKYMRIMKDLPKMWEGLEKVKSKMIDSQNKTNLRGSGKQSNREKRHN